MWVLLALLALVLAELVVSFVTHDSRQRHLAYEFTQSTTRVETGQALLNLQIPSISLNEIVVEGATASELRSGPGRVEASAEIGGQGNTVILGRRSRYGGPFGRLDELEEGASIAVKTRQGVVRLYQVDSVERVDDSDAAPVERTEDEQLTLVTSGNGLTPERRLVVTASPREGSAEVDPTPSAGHRVSLGSIDQRPTSVFPGGLLVWTMIAGLCGVIFLVGRELCRRYSRVIVAIALSPIAALVALLILYSVDIFLPTTL